MLFASGHFSHVQIPRQHNHRERGGGERECIPEKSYIVHCSGVYIIIVGGVESNLRSHCSFVATTDKRKGEREREGWSVGAEEISCKNKSVELPCRDIAEGYGMYSTTRFAKLTIGMLNSSGYYPSWYTMYVCALFHPQ